jgi:hypothetical protein
MNTGKCIVGAALILSWALLFSARYIAAGIFAVSGTTYDFALDRVGLFLPICAWLCLGAGGSLVLTTLFFQPNSKTNHESKDA